MSLVVTGAPPLLVTHIPMTEVPEGTANVHGHVHNNEPLRAGPYVNICVTPTTDRSRSTRCGGSRGRAWTTLGRGRRRRPGRSSA